MSESIGVVMIGGGVMGGALVDGFLGRDVGGRMPEVTIVEADPGRADLWRQRGDVRVGDLAESVSGAEVVFLAVKPHHITGVLDAVSEHLPTDAAVVSIAAGIPLDVMESHLPTGTAIVRMMPNTPTRIGKGVIGLTPGPGCSREQVELITALVAKVSTVVEIPEDLQDALTATSGSGPAYVFYLAEAMRAAARELGLPDDEAIVLVSQTILGAAELLAHDPSAARELRESVTSKGGTTAAATSVFDEDDFTGLVTRAMTAARDRAREMADDAR